jgi:hypothetical protein
MNAQGKLKICIQDSKENNISDSIILEGEFLNRNLYGKGRYSLENGDFY